LRFDRSDVCSFTAENRFRSVGAGTAGTSPGPDGVSIGNRFYFGTAARRFCGQMAWTERTVFPLRRAAIPRHDTHRARRRAPRRTKHPRPAAESLARRTPASRQVALSRLVPGDLPIVPVLSWGYPRGVSVSGSEFARLQLGNRWTFGLGISTDGYVGPLRRRLALRSDQTGPGHLARRSRRYSHVLVASPWHRPRDAAYPSRGYDHGLWFQQRGSHDVRVAIGRSRRQRIGARHIARFYVG